MAMLPPPIREDCEQGCDHDGGDALKGGDGGGDDGGRSCGGDDGRRGRLRKASRKDPCALRKTDLGRRRRIYKSERKT